MCFRKLNTLDTLVINTKINESKSSFERMKKKALLKYLKIPVWVSVAFELSLSAASLSLHCLDLSLPFTVML